MRDCENGYVCVRERESMVISLSLKEHREKKLHFLSLKTHTGKTKLHHLSLKKHRGKNQHIAMHNYAPCPLENTTQHTHIY